jgi:hypothetical protein
LPVAGVEVVEAVMAQLQFLEGPLVVAVVAELDEMLAVVEPVVEQDLLVQQRPLEQRVHLQRAVLEVPVARVQEV